MFHALHDGISEFTFANIYLFRQSHNYRLTQVADGTLVLLGRDDDIPFFMLPFALPEPKILAQLFKDQGMMKAASASQITLIISITAKIWPCCAVATTIRNVIW